MTQTPPVKNTAATDETTAESLILVEILIILAILVHVPISASISVSGSGLFVMASVRPASVSGPTFTSPFAVLAGYCSSTAAINVTVIESSDKSDDDSDSGKYFFLVAFTD
ncbi:hypothetical protein C0995_000802 [Termitomyces sp. Mi166|nr:hypothetical protein C0995_000802 [Termitomyces sp. Mi166\